MNEEHRTNPKIIFEFLHYKTVSILFGLKLLLIKDPQNNTLHLMQKNAQIFI